MRISPFILPVMLLASTCRLVAGTPDKSAYNRFNPVPDALLRDMDTDRPDNSNSPPLSLSRQQITLEIPHHGN